MLSVLVLALSGPALAQDFVVQVAEPVIFEQGGVWSRPLPVAGGWKLGFATQNDFWVADLVQGESFGEWELDRDGKVNLTNYGEFKDQAIKRCPDGTWLLGSSADLETGQDSSHWTWLDEDFTTLGSGWVEEAVPERGHNDLAVMCNHLAQGVGHIDFEYPSPNTSVFLQLDLEEGPEAEHMLLDFRAEGGSLRLDTRDDTFVGIQSSHQGDASVVVWDSEWEEVSRRDIELVDAPDQPYWPQGLLRLGDYWVVATMAAEDVQSGNSTGDVWVAVLDSDFSSLERHRVTTFLPEAGASRPWIDRRGSQALVGFDRENRHGVVELELDLVAFGLDPDADDTGGGEAWSGGSGEGGDDAGSGGDDDGSGGSGGCGGCDAGSSALGLWGLAALVAVGRRRS